MLDWTLFRDEEEKGGGENKRQVKEAQHSPMSWCVLRDTHMVPSCEQPLALLSKGGEGKQ